MTATINIFNMPQVVTLTLGGNTGAFLMNYPIASCDFTLNKGVTNELLFFVKDTDRQPVTANTLASYGLTNIHVVITDPNQCDRLLLGTSNASIVTSTVTTTTTTVTLSNAAVVTTNTVVVVANTVNEANAIINAVANNFIISSTGAGTYTVPDVVNAITVELWGPGGSGSQTPLYGAGGGAYASSTFSVTPGQTFPYYVGMSAFPEQATYWGNTNVLNATFGAWGGSDVVNNVVDIYDHFSTPFGNYDVGYYGAVATSNTRVGQASAWSGGNASSNPAGLNASSTEGGGPSNGAMGTTPGGGAPANGQPTVLGGPGQIRITQYIDQQLVDDLANAAAANAAMYANVTTNSVTIVNSITTTNTVVYTTTNEIVDYSVLVPAPNIDPARGVWLLSLPASVISDWPLGYLRYSVVCDRTFGDQVMLYTDRNYTPYGYLNILPGPYPNPPEATTIPFEDFIKDRDSWYSSAFPGAAYVGNLSGEMSAVFYANCFTGSVTIQASLEDQPSAEICDWFTIPKDSYAEDCVVMNCGGCYGNTNGYGYTIDYNTGSLFFNNNTTGPIYIGFRGNYMWVRFVVHKEVFNPAVGGAFDGIVYRND